MDLLICHCRIYMVPMFNKTSSIQWKRKSLSPPKPLFSCTYSSNSKAKLRVKHVTGNGLFKHSDHCVSSVFLQVLNKGTEWICQLDLWVLPSIKCKKKEREISLTLILLCPSPHLLLVCDCWYWQNSRQNKLNFTTKLCHSIIVHTTYYLFYSFGYLL